MSARRTAPPIAVPPLIGWPPHVAADDVVWCAEEARWVGRTSRYLTKRARRAVEEAAEFERKRSDPQS
jgi:hypothetical protein